MKKLILLLAIAALFAGCTPDVVLGNHEDVLTVSPSEQKISADGTASFTFTFKLLKPSNNNVKELVDLKETKTIATIHFEATGGTVNPASATTETLQRQRPMSCRLPAAETQSRSPRR